MTWLETPMAMALARALVHFLWEGALIAALLWVVLRGMRRGTSQARYLAACAGMSAMVAAFIVTVWMLMPPGATYHMPIAVSGMAFKLTDLALPPMAIAGDPYRLLWGWVVALWLAGVAVFYVRSAGGWVSAQRMRRRSVVAVDEVWHARLRELCERAGVSRAVSLVESGLAEAPAVIGFLRPMILMPAGLMIGLRADQVEALLLHELAHIRRHDYLTNLAQIAVEGLLFYHPAIWWVSRVLRTERENCCDDAAVAVSGDARGYAETLAMLESIRIAEPAVAATGGNLLERVRRLLKSPECPSASGVPLMAAGVLLCACAAILSAWQTNPVAPPPAPQPRIPPAPSMIQRKTGNVAEQIRQPAVSPYQKWVAEDVAYVIRSEERDAFERLQTNAEREHFIEQFWQRRDPTPGTLENEFKAEHYRRIGYSNENFGAANLQGWKSDRGRVYIIYGPPDEKETHPAGDGGGPPYEVWLFHRPGGDMTIRFTDTNRDGAYRQTPEIRPFVGQIRIEAPRGRPLVLGQASIKETPRRIQPNGDYLFDNGSGTTVRVGPDGATLIAVQTGGPADAGRLIREPGDLESRAVAIRVILTRVTRHDGGGVVAFDESFNNNYTKLIALEPGQYRLRTEATSAGRPTARASIGFQVGPKPSR